MGNFSKYDWRISFESHICRLPVICRDYPLVSWILIIQTPNKNEWPEIKIGPELDSWPKEGIPSDFR